MNIELKESSVKSPAWNGRHLLGLEELSKEEIVKRF